MDSPTQFLRYGIPGWILILTVASILGSSMLINRVVAVALGVYMMESWSVAGMALAGGAAGIPLGFIVYQIYFAAFWLAFYRSKWKLEGVVCKEGQAKPCFVCKEDQIYKKIVGLESISTRKPFIRILAWITGFAPTDIQNKIEVAIADQTCWRLFIPAFRRSCSTNEYAIGAYYSSMSILHALGASTFGLGIGYILAIMAILLLLHGFFALVLWLIADILLLVAMQKVRVLKNYNQVSVLVLLVILIPWATASLIILLCGKLGSPIMRLELTSLQGFWAVVCLGLIHIFRINRADVHRHLYGILMDAIQNVKIGQGENCQSAAHRQST